MRVIHDAADPDANIIFGTVPVETMANSMKITVIATGFEKENIQLLPERNARPVNAAYRPTITTAGPATGGTGGAADLDDLDVPTFIRKRAD